MSNAKYREGMHLIHHRRMQQPVRLIWRMADGRWYVARLDSDGCVRRRTVVSEKTLDAEYRAATSVEIAILLRGAK